MKNKLYDLTESCVEAANYVVKLNTETEQTQIIEYTTLIRDAAICILDRLNERQEAAINSKLYCKNIIVSANKALIDSQKNYHRHVFEIRPFCLELHRLMALELNLIDLSEYVKKREAAFGDIHNCFNDEHTFKVSIVLVAYNKLEYTKKAVESIYKYTDFEKNQVELITVNNGSTDGTAEYFSSLPNVKKMNLEYNIMGTGAPRHISDGKFIVGFSNDVVATTNWLENLLTCIESDENIYMVVPTCNKESISNGQGIAVPYKNNFANLDAMQKFAAQYNHSDWRQWEERSTLMPFVDIFRFSRNQYINTSDCLYTQVEFSDDDYATSLRRAGMKLILAKDTFLHHFGSVTLREEQKNNSSLENMRRVYFSKWGVDAWESRAIFPGIENLLPARIAGDLKVMVIEPRFGGVFLQLKNYYKKRGIIFSKSTAICTDQRYIDDVQAMFDDSVFEDTLSSAINVNKDMFDIITSGRYLGELQQNSVIDFLECLYMKLRPGGAMIFPVMNYGSVQIVLDMLLQGAIPSYEHGVDEFSGFSFDLLKKRLQKHSFLNRFEMVALKGNFSREEGVVDQMIALIDKAIQPLDDHQRICLKGRFNIHSAFFKIYRQ